RRRSCRLKYSGGGGGGPPQRRGGGGQRGRAGRPASWPPNRRGHGGAPTRPCRVRPGRGGHERPRAGYRPRPAPPPTAGGGALRARGLRIAILDADFNGPSQARMAGVQQAVFVPGRSKVALPRTESGIGVFSMGSLLPESEALEFETTVREESQTWRATKEF